VIRWWHRFVLGHKMLGPRPEGDDWLVWRDVVCGRDFHKRIWRVNPDAPPL
jgi:hypothetical protein